MIEYAGILTLSIFAALLAYLFVFLASRLGPKRSNPVKEEPFECGEKPFSIPKRGVPVHFYLIAMLFVIFDVELAFLFPWAVLFKKLGLIGLIEIGVFVFFIFIGYVYALKKGALDIK
ncbi:MAG: NADH-quinone oxidoreductase subunit A [Candidatus Omnitrophica bacterium]|nr:NADH-quinone oxidoreductase subunit A [Candidatus Omnitrophota bacterium]